MNPHTASPAELAKLADYLGRRALAGRLACLDDIAHAGPVPAADCGCPTCAASAAPAQ